MIQAGSMMMAVHSCLESCCWLSTGWGLAGVHDWGFVNQILWSDSGQHIGCRHMHGSCLQVYKEFWNHVHSLHTYASSLGSDSVLHCSHVSLSVLTCHKLPPLILCERVIVNCMNWELLAMRNIDCPVCFNLSMITWMSNHVLTAWTQWTCCNFCALLVKGSCMEMYVVQPLALTLCCHWSCHWGLWLAHCHCLGQWLAEMA